MRDWNEPRPRGTHLATIDRIMKALRQIEAGRAPETQWEQETYSAAFAQGIVRRPLDEPNAPKLTVSCTRSLQGDGSLFQGAGAGPKKVTRNFFERGGAPTLTAAGWKKFSQQGMSALAPVS